MKYLTLYTEDLHKKVTNKYLFFLFICLHGMIPKRSNPTKAYATGPNDEARHPSVNIQQFEFVRIRFAVMERDISPRVDVFQASFHIILGMKYSLL